MINDIDISYGRARRQRYLTEIGLPAQVGAIIDELAALRAHLVFDGAPAFTALLERISAIKADIPKEGA